MPENHQIDNLDKKILNTLLANARTPYAVLAKKFKVSPATIHVRVEKMKVAGIITGTHLAINPRALGFDVCCFIGINLRSAADYHHVMPLLMEFDEVVEAYFTTGQYSILVKIMTQSIDALQKVLMNKIQAIKQVQSTDTLISLQNPISRAIQP